MRPRLRLLTLVVTMAGAFVAHSPHAPAASKKPLFTHPVHRGSSGKQVVDAKWVLSGHNQGLRKPKIHTFHGKRTKECGKKCVRAILAARWLLGEPLKYDKSCRCHPAKRTRFDRDLYLLLTTKKARPLGWIGRASQRLAAVRKQRAAQAPQYAKKAVAIALREYRIGVFEEPIGSNWGVKGHRSERIRWYQSVTGAYHAPWCASFVQAVYLWSGVGTIANRSAGVFYIASWGHQQGLIRARPVIGSEVLYMRNLGHTGIVVKVNRTTFETVEGNSGQRVAYHVYPLGYYRTIFLVPKRVQGARA